MRYIVIGAGPAGVVAAETLRSQDPDGEILLIGGEPEPAYSRMAIPYLLANHINEEGTYLRHDADHFRNLRIQQIQQKATSLDPTTDTLTLADGSSLSYDRLLLATGSRPVSPPIDGLDQPGIHHCWTLEDARNIIRYAEPGSPVVLMGAGFIGCIIMEALVERGVKLTVVEMDDRMVPRMMDQTAGNLIKQWCIDKGVQVHTSTRVLAVKPDSLGDSRFLLQCEPKGEIHADLIIVAAGVKPDTGFLADSGIEVGEGIIVDEYLRTSNPKIYAAGDVCEGFDWSTGKRALNAIQPVAVETGRVAALNMTGTQAPYPGGMAMNVLDTVGLISTSYGQWMGVEDGEESQLLDQPGYRYINLKFKDDRLVGAITLGMTQHIGVVRGLIQSRLKLGKWKQVLMNDPTRVMEAYLGSSQQPGAA